MPEPPRPGVYTPSEPRIQVPDLPNIPRVVYEPVIPDPVEPPRFPRPVFPMPKPYQQPYVQRVYGPYVEATICDVYDIGVTPFFGKRHGTIVNPISCDLPYAVYAPIVYYGTNVKAIQCDPIPPITPKPPKVYGPYVYAPTPSPILPIPKVYGPYVSGVYCDVYDSRLPTRFGQKIGSTVPPIQCDPPPIIVPEIQKVYGPYVYAPTPSPILPIPKVYGPYVSGVYCDVYDSRLPTRFGQKTGSIVPRSNRN